MFNAQYYIQKFQHLLPEFINILLVHRGERDAFLLETCNRNFREFPMKDENENIKLNYKIIQKFASNLNLQFTMDQFSNKNYPRFFITKEKMNAPDSDEEIGKLLGFYGYNHNFSNYYEDRYGVHINCKYTTYKGEELKEELYAEMTEIEKTDKKELKTFIEEKIKKWTKSLFDLNVKFTYTISKVYGINTLLDRLDKKDIDFIYKNYEEYINYLHNFEDDVCRNKLQSIVR